MLHEIKKYWNFKSPLFRFSSVLFIYAVLALINLFEFSVPSWWLYSNNELFYRSLISLGLIFLATDLFYILNYYVFKFKNINPLHLGITACIIYLLIHPTEELWVFPFIVLVSIGLKLIVRWKGKPLFNPAAFGILISYYLLELLRDTSLQITWWGSDFGLRNINIGEVSISIFPPIFSVLFLYFAYKFRKHLYGLTFFLSFLISLLVYSFISIEGITLSIFFQLFLISFPTWAFLTFVMIVEPKTSPVLKNHQIFLGLLGGVLYLLFIKYSKGLNSPELHIILFMNLLTFLIANNSTPKTLLFKKTTKLTIKN